METGRRAFNRVLNQISRARLLTQQRAGIPPQPGEFLQNGFGLIGHGRLWLREETTDTPFDSYRDFRVTGGDRIFVFRPTAPPLLRRCPSHKGRVLINNHPPLVGGASSLRVGEGEVSRSLKVHTYRLNSRIALSKPSRVSGYIRPPMSWRMSWLEAVPCQYLSGTGFNQIALE